MPKRSRKKINADVHKDLKGFEIKINSFGEMETNFSIEKLNEFLNENSSTKTEPQSEEE